MNTVNNPQLLAVAVNFLLPIEITNIILECSCYLSLNTVYAHYYFKITAARSYLIY